MRHDEHVYMVHLIGRGHERVNALTHHGIETWVVLEAALLGTRGIRQRRQRRWRRSTAAQHTPPGGICALRDRYGRSHSTAKACIPGTGLAWPKTSQPRLHCVYFLADRAIRWVAVPNTNEGISPPRLQQVGKLTEDPQRNWAPWVLTISGRAHIRTYSPNTPVSLCSVSKGVWPAQERGVSPTQQGRQGPEGLPGEGKAFVGKSWVGRFALDEEN